MNTTIVWNTALLFAEVATNFFLLRWLLRHPYRKLVIHGAQ